MYPVKIITVEESRYLEKKTDESGTSFAEMIPESGGAQVGPGTRLRQVLEEIELAESVGLDVYGLGEHHRPDFASSSPATTVARSTATSVAAKKIDRANINQKNERGPTSTIGVSR